MTQKENKPKDIMLGYVVVSAIFFAFWLVVVLADLLGGVSSGGFFGSDKIYIDIGMFLLSIGMSIIGFLHIFSLDRKNISKWSFIILGITIALNVFAYMRL